MIVVDASAAVKWITGEQDSEAANQLLSGSEPISGPFLLRTEVAAAIARKARFGEITKADASAAIELWASVLQGSDISLLAEDDDLAPALKLSLELNHPLQDCIYLALSQRLGAPLITADSKFAAKARRRYPHVQPLTEA